MGDAAYRGISAEQDGRFRNKEKVLLKKLAASGQFPAQFDQRVDMNKVNMEVMRPWISERVEQLLGFEDDVVVEYVSGMLEDPDNRQPDPRKMQLSLTGFLESSTPTFMKELWTLLLSAQSSIGGIPQEFVERKKEEMRQARERDAAAITASGAAQRGCVSHMRRDERRGGRFDGPSRQNGTRAGWHGRSRWDDEDRRPRQRPVHEFVDKSGNRTERAQDRGWGSRARRPPSSSPSRSRSPDGDHRRRTGEGRYYDDRERDTRAVGRPSYRRQRDISDSPDGRRSYGRGGRQPSYSPSPSPPPRTRGRDERSLTPQLRSRHRDRSLSITPPRRRADRSPTYSPQPSARYAARAQRSPNSPAQAGHRDKTESAQHRDKRDGGGMLARSRWARDDD